MANAEPQSRFMTVDEYLRFEEQSDIRHEYVEGRVYPMSDDITGMTGGTLNHSKIAFRIGTALNAASVRAGCEIYLNDVKVRVDDAFYYPDVIVACGPHNGQDLVVNDPCLIVEVTSPSTERTDRREKKFAYIAIPSLKSYLVVEQDERRVEHHYRDKNGQWTHDEIRQTGTIQLGCPNTSMSLDDIYARVEFPTMKERLRVREEGAEYDAS